MKSTLIGILLLSCSSFVYAANCPMNPVPNCTGTPESICGGSYMLDNATPYACTWVEGAGCQREGGACKYPDATQQSTKK